MFVKWRWTHYSFTIVPQNNLNIKTGREKYKHKRYDKKNEILIYEYLLLDLTGDGEERRFLECFLQYTTEYKHPHSKFRKKGTGRISEVNLLESSDASSLESLSLLFLPLLLIEEERVLLCLLESLVGLCLALSSSFSFERSLFLVASSLTLDLCSFSASFLSSLTSGREDLLLDSGSFALSPVLSFLSLLFSFEPFRSPVFSLLECFASCLLWPSSPFSSAILPLLLLSCRLSWSGLALVSLAWE